MIINRLNQRTIFKHLIFGVIGVLLASSAAHAQSDRAATEQVQAQLIASVEAVSPGQQILIGVQQRIVPHWHTYWRNPGDSGLSTKIAWELPQGASAGEILWPAPNRFTLGPVVNYGYEHEVTLLSPVTVGKDAQVGGSFPVKAKVNWLVCQEVCIPQQVDLALSLPIVAAKQSEKADRRIFAAVEARLPRASPWPIYAESTPAGIALKIAGAPLQSSAVKDIWFYPNQWGHVAHNAAQPHKNDGASVVLTLTPGDAPLAAGQALTGVLSVSELVGNETVTRAYNVDVPLTGVVASAITPTQKIATTVAAANPVGPASPHDPDIGLAPALLLALLGGLILNLMPCVFPILSIKALSLLNHAQQSPLQTRLQGLVYTAGVLASFALLGGVLIVLKAGGGQVGWGFQFQSPTFVLIVAYLMFAVGLSLSGVFTIGASVAGIGSSLADRPGYTGSFFTGVLATIVATPCTAPFMGGALGFALTQPPLPLMAVFLSLGLGLALPYLLLTTWPLLQRCLPRPGRWMDRVKQALAFPMYLAAVWLVWVLAQQAGVNAVAIGLGGMVLIAFAAWLYDSTRLAAHVRRHTGTAIAAVLVVVALAGGFVGIRNNPAGTSAPGQNQNVSAQNWTPYSAERLQTLRAKGQPVFVNLTAAWCITCLVNERVALNDASVVDALAQKNITYLKGDWTNQDQAITALLRSFGRSGVPLYVFYPAGSNDSPGSPVVLPQLLTPAIVLAALNSLNK